MNQYEFLMHKLQQQSSLYKPGLFWQKATDEILKDLIENGLESFRSLPSSLKFFVPTYGYPGSGVSKQTICSFGDWQKEQRLTVKQDVYFDNFICGNSSAIADYRTLAASEYANKKAPYLMGFSESKVGLPAEQFLINGNNYSRSSLNYLMGLSFLKKFIDFSNIKTVMEIGGGFGTLGEILNQVSPEVKYINLDIPPTLFFSSFYLNQVIGTENVTLYDDLASDDVIDVDKLNRVSNLPAWEAENLRGKVDLFVNFISFQEMEPEIVSNYLNQVSRLGADWVLLRNMREGKQVSSNDNIGVNKPVLAEDYLKMLDDYYLVEKNVIPYGFKTTDGYHSEIMLFKRK